MEEKIDLKDRKILAKLDFYARESVSQIAKKVGVSKEVALYRIKNLEARNIIKQYYAIVNTAKLGYCYCRFLAKFHNINKRIEEEIISHLRKNKKTAYLGLIDGSWDLICGFWAKDIFEFEEFIDNFVFKYGKYIHEKEVSIGSHLSQFNYEFLTETKNKEEFKTGGKVQLLKLDSIGKRLLVLLTENARINYEQLSKKLNLTGKAISYRISNLIEKEVIVGFRALIDYKKFGYSNSKVLLCLQSLTEKEFNKLLNYLKKLENCIYITKVIGTSDLEFEILTKSREEFFLVMKELRENFNKIIRKHEHYIIHEELLSRFIPLES